MTKYRIKKLNTARNSFRYIIKTFNIKEIHIPYYLCPAIRQAAYKENCKIYFYHINKDFSPAVKFPKNAYILYPNYFGVCGRNIDKLEKEYPNLIVDNAHSFFSEPRGIASFNSLRKFFPILKDGSFLYITKNINLNIEKDYFKYEYNTFGYEELCKNEYRLDKEDIKYMSDCTSNYFASIDINSEKQKFLEKYKFYSNKYALKNELIMEIQNESVPYKYPYLAKDDETANMTAEILKKDGIEIFRYWNNMPDNYIEKIFYKRLLAI